MTLGTTVYVAGGLFPAQLLERIAAGDATLPGTKPLDYHCDSATELNQAINRAWAALTGRWATFQAQRTLLPAGDRATTLTREKWLLPLFQELGYGRLAAERGALVADDRPFAISHRWGHVPIHLVGATLDLDKRVPGERGAAASPPHGLVQDLLNHADGHLWAFLSNGLELRILRDHRSLTRQAYVSFDLEAMFDGDQFSAFRLLWLLCHQSRVEGDDPRQCWLERWVTHTQDEGVRALDRLRGGVEKAITHLGSGFLKHRANEGLKGRLTRGELSTQEFYRELLKLVYRLIFLFVAEDRDLLLVPDAPEVAKDRFRRLYATKRLRSIATKRRGGPHDDGWAALRVVMRQLDQGNPDVALPALGSFLWSTEDVGGGRRRSRAIPDLDEATLANEGLYAALAALCVVQDGPVRRAVDWAGVQADELGSVYEALMEKVPRVDVPAASFVLDDAAGNERRTTGSYYTPDSLVQCLLDTALDPVLDEAAKKPDPERAILDLAVVDPACGSGHFLVAAARRIAHRLARVRTGGIEPSPPEVQHAIREVVGRCIYGVDLNPMAVELCKVSLWMEAIEPGRPLSFLDGHIRHGNALLGATPALLEKGVPDEAWDPIEGDDKAVAKALKARNKKERKGQGDLYAAYMAAEGQGTWDVLSGQVRRVEDAPDDSLEAVRAKESAWQRLQASPQVHDAWFLADLWCSAFVWPKDREHEATAPTQELFRRVRQDPARCPPETRREVERIARQYELFHWHLAFPRVFARDRGEADAQTGWEGGFDVVLGNPPWERVKLQEQEFFATRSEAIATAPNASARKKLINALPETDAPLWADWCAASREAEGQSQFVRLSARYPLCGKGDVNTYSVFAEHNRAIIGSLGRAGFVIPSGIATDDTTKDFFGALIGGNELRSLWDFQTGPGLFSDIGHARFKFCLLTLGHGAQPADLVFFLRSVEELLDSGRHFSLTFDDFVLLNPNTRTCPTFRSRRDAHINLALYRRAGVLWRENVEDGNPWRLRFMRMLDMANDSGLFRTREQLEAEGWTLVGNRFVQDGRAVLPLVEAKMVHHFDHRYGDYSARAPDSENTSLPDVPLESLQNPTYSPIARYWVASHEVDQRLADRWSNEWLLGWRDICRSFDERTVIATLIPRAATGDTFLLAMPATYPEYVASLYANLCSFSLDYAARQKVGGTHLKYHVFRQLPVLPPVAYKNPTAWCGARAVDWILTRVLELAYTAWDLEPFARDCSYDGPPFQWDPARRFVLRAELDAAFFHLYGLSRDDTDYILDTFPIVRKNDEKAYGEYRTKRVILEIYDAMAEAARTGVPYQTRLDPPPADPRVAHPDTRDKAAVRQREAEVIEFPRRPTPRPAQPAWGPAVLPAAAQAVGIPLSPNALSSPQLSPENLGLYALSSALRAIGEPATRERVEMVAVGTLLPSLLYSRLDDTTKRGWQQAFGASTLALASVGALRVPWLAVLQRAMREDVLDEDLSGRWAAGARANDARLASLDVRAKLAVAWLESASWADDSLQAQQTALRA